MNSGRNRKDKFGILRDWWQTIETMCLDCNNGSELGEQRPGLGNISYIKSKGLDDLSGNEKKVQ